MLLFRPLYEAWLLRASAEPLPLWQRHLLLRALAKDEALRCLALELAEFNQPDALPADLHAPDLQLRLQRQIQAEAAPVYAWRPGWATAAAALGLCAGLLGLWWLEPAKQNVELAQVQQEAEAAALRLPSLTPTPTPTPSPSASPSPTPSPSETSTPTP